MQNYGQYQGGYQRPGSTTGFAGSPAVPPPYGTPQGYQTAALQSQGQWAPPAPSQTPVQQQWNQPQPQPQAGGYNPGVYGAMPGGYSQSQQTPNQTPMAYHTQQQDVPPPPPPKPAAFASTLQHQNTQDWTAQGGHGAQQPQQSYQTPQGGYTQQSEYQAQQSSTAPAPPPPSQTPGGSYFSSSQTPQVGGRPGSIYGADQAGTYSTPASAVAQHPPSSVLSPNEQHPAYIPPSLTGQGVQSYAPSNTNPMPGIYVPPPPDIPAWQQASHAPLQGGNKFKYTKPAPDAGLYGQAQQGVPPAQGQGQYGQQPAFSAQQFGHSQHSAQAPQSAQYGQPMQNQFSQGSHKQGQHEAAYPQQSQYGQPTPQAQYIGQPAPPYHAPPQDQPSQPQPYQQQPPQTQWQPTPEQTYSQQPDVQASYSGQQQTWHPGHHTHVSVAGRQNTLGNEQSVQAPKPVSGQTGTTPPGFFSEPSPQSQPVSPIQNRFSTSFNTGQAGTGRTDSVSSIALGAIHAQRAGNRTESTPPPPRDDVTKFSALGTGGPSDWEHFGGGEEVDDEELFAAKKDGRQGVPVQLDSIEVPSHQVSPPQVQGAWPTPPVQPATTNPPNRDTYQPTPPPNISAQRPPSQPPQHSSVIGNGPPSQVLQQSQHSFVMNEAVVAPLRFSRPSSQQSTPAQQQPRHHPPSAANTSFAMDDGGRVQHGVTDQTASAYAAELKIKDDALAQLRAEFEKERTDLHAEAEQLEIVIETTKKHAEYERNVLIEQIETMKTATEEAKKNADVSTKEHESTIERLKEDAEGKEDTIREKNSEVGKLRDEVRAKEDEITKGHAFVNELKRELEVKDSEIGNLKQQIKNNQTAERLAYDLKEQLEAEKSKAPPRPAPADLISDLDPWYAGSLERYIAMLRNEASESVVENKIKAFTGFLKAESTARGLDYGAPAAPPAPIGQQQRDNVPSTAPAYKDHDAPGRKSDLNVQVPPGESPGDDIQYSPGGRPIVQQRPKMKSEQFGHPQQSFSVSSQSTTVLTPTSSQGENLSKTPTPMRSPPAESYAQSQYKAYIPPSVSQKDSVQSIHRQSISSVSPMLNPGFAFGTKKDEVFFGAPTGTSSPSSTPNTGGNATPDLSVPAPLFTQHPSALAPKSAPKGDPIAKLTKILPANVGVPKPNHQLEAVRQKLSDYRPELPSLQDLTASCDKMTSMQRRKNDEARRKRQENSEAETDQLFNDHEISYADIAVIENEFKEKEGILKAEEDRQEYEVYVKNVFDKIYNGLQREIKDLMDLCIETKSLLSTAVSGIKSFEGSDAAIIEDCLKVLVQLFEQIEPLHEKVVEAVAERDKRYKKTEIQPLYAAGNIAKMKDVQKHFSNAEKEAAQRARAEKEQRVSEFVRAMEATVIAVVGVEQQEIQDIIAAVRDLPSSMDHEKLLTRARETVLALGDSSKSLLLLLNDIEIDVGGTIHEAQLAEAKAEKQAEKAAQLNTQISERERELREELKRKEAVLDQDRQEIDKVIKEVKEMGNKPAEGGGVELSEEELKKERLSKALEAAKRRNGDL